MRSWPVLRSVSCCSTTTYRPGWETKGDEDDERTEQKEASEPGKGQKASHSLSFVPNNHFEGKMGHMRDDFTRSPSQKAKVSLRQRNKRKEIPFPRRLQCVFEELTGSLHVSTFARRLYLLKHFFCLTCSTLRPVRGACVRNLL